MAWGRVAKSATFGVKWASDESFCPSTVYTLPHRPLAPPSPHHNFPTLLDDAIKIQLANNALQSSSEHYRRLGGEDMFLAG